MHKNHAEILDVIVLYILSHLHRNVTSPILGKFFYDIQKYRICNFVTSDILCMN